MSLVLPRLCYGARPSGCVSRRVVERWGLHRVRTYAASTCTAGSPRARTRSIRTVPSATAHRPLHLEDWSMELARTWAQTREIDEGSAKRQALGTARQQQSSRDSHAAVTGSAWRRNHCWNTSDHSAPRPPRSGLRRRRAESAVGRVESVETVRSRPRARDFSLRAHVAHRARNTRIPQRKPRVPRLYYCVR